MRLLVVELARIRARRAIMVLVAGAFLLGSVFVGATLWTHRPVSDADLAQAQQQVERQTNSPRTQRELQRCQNNPERYGSSGAAECEDMVLPRVDWFLDRPVLNPPELARDLSVALVLFLGVIAVLVGATMIGAEWSAGSVGTQLLFEPRRPRVWAAKAAAIALVTAVMAAAVFAFVWLSILATYAVWSDDGLPAGFFGDLSLTGARGAAFVAVGGLAGYAVTMAVRHTVAVVGLMFAYSVIGEGVLRSFLPRIEPLLVSNNAVAWIQDGHTIRTFPQQCFDEFSCRPETTVIGLLDAAVYFGVVAAVMLMLSLFVFHRRDVP
ncbi:MAG: ABC transporter permease subunit [Nocardioidaceae bacterium]|nr:ABC transporter permease subunit [Nocardioidaceae bacterium]